MQLRMSGELLEDIGLDTGYTPAAFGPKATQVHITVGDARMREADVPVLQYSYASMIFHA